MSQGRIHDELEFNVVGRGLNDLKLLANRLKASEAAGVSLAQTLPVTTAKLNTNSAAVRRATTAYKNYTTWIRKAASAQKTMGGVTAPTTRAAATPTTVANAATAATSEEAALAIQRASTERSVALAKAAAAKREAIVKAEAARKTALIEYAAAREAAILQGGNARQVALLQANATQQLAVTQARITRELALEISAQDQKIAIAKAGASRKIGTTGVTSQVTLAKAEAAEELAVVQAMARNELAARAALEAEATALAKAGATQRIAASRAEAEAAALPIKQLKALSNQRYALNDVSRTAGIAAVTLGALAVIPQVISANYTREFNSVIRTTNTAGDSAEALKQDFIDLSTSMPESFGALTQIGTIAGQLNISSDAVAGFTENVAQFTATTGVNTEEAATNIGRLAQLTHTSAANYTNLTSAIYQVGVTSVATEGEILDLGSQIATAGDLAGFSNVQIVALAGSLASLGIQPEAARGSLQRIFNIIENGASGSSKATASLAKIAGVTTTELQGMWNNGAEGSQEFFTAFVEGLGELQNEGVNTSNVLADLGINAVRDQRLMQVLANNTDIYTNSLKESTTAYATGTAMTDAYAKQTDNLIDTFKVVGNQFLAMMNAFGQDQALNGAVKAFSSFLGIVLDLVQGPVGQFLLRPAITLFATVGAGAALFVLAATKMRGAMYGMMTAAESTAGGVNVTATSFGNLTRQLIQTAIAFGKGNLTQARQLEILNGVSAASNKATASLNMQTAATTRMGAVTQRLSGALTAASGGLKSFAKAGAWMIALTVGMEVVGNAADAIAKHFRSASDSAKALYSDNQELAGALQADKKAFDESGAKIREFTREQINALGTTNNFSKVSNTVAGSQDNMANSVKGASDEIANQTQVIGKATSALLVKMVTDSKEFQELWTRVGSSFDGDNSIGDYFKRIATDADAGLGFAQKKYEETALKLEEARQKAASPENDTPEENAAFNNQIKMYLQQLEVWKMLGNQSNTLNGALHNASSGMQLTGIAAKALETDLEGTAEGAETASNSISSLLDTARAPGDLGKAWYDLGAAIGENGKEFDGFGDKAQANLSAVSSLLSELEQQAGGDESKFGANIAGALVALQSQGIKTGGSLSYMGDVLNQLFGTKWGLDFNSADAQGNLLQVIDKAILAQQEFVNLQFVAITSAQMSGDAAAVAGAQAAYAAAQAQLAEMEAFRATALAGATKNQKAYNSGVNAGAKALNNNSGASKRNAAQTKKTAKTYADWASELKQVMERADELRWGVSDAMKNIKQVTADAVKSMVENLYDFDGAYNKAFGKREFTDSVLSIYYDVMDAARDAADAVIDATNDIIKAQADLAGISSDKASLTYGLQVAIDYGDTLREQSIRAELAELDAQELDAKKSLADAQRALAEAQDAQNKSLTGNSKQAIKNRQTVQDLLGTYTDYISSLVDAGASVKDVEKAVKSSKADFLAQGASLGYSATELKTYAAIFDSYTATTVTGSAAAEESVRELYDAWQDYITQLASSGASQKTINAAIAQGKKEVVELAKQLGLGPKQVNDYVKAFDGMKTIVDKVPKNVTIKFGSNADAAGRAISEFRGKIDAAKTSAGNLNATLGKIPPKINTQMTFSVPSYGKQMKLAAAAEVTYWSKALQNSGHSTQEYKSKQLAKWKAEAKKWANYSSGGFTGRGGVNEPAGEVHRGEYVVPQSQVNQSTGQPYFMEAAWNPTITTSSAVGVQMVELSPTDRELLANAGGTFELLLDGKAITATVNRTNKNNTVRGVK